MGRKCMVSGGEATAASHTGKMTRCDETQPPQPVAPRDSGSHSDTRVERCSSTSAPCLSLLHSLLRNPWTPLLGFLRRKNSIRGVTRSMSCPSENQVVVDQSKFWDSNGIHWTPHRIGWAIAGGCAVLVGATKIQDAIHRDLYTSRRSLFPYSPYFHIAGS